MATEAERVRDLCCSVITYVRTHHPETIDKAYDYFWDGQKPDEFLTGIALDLGFLNFEDWLLCDFKANPEGETFLDIYASKIGIGESEAGIAEKLKASRISLYEVVSASSDKGVTVRDLLRGGETVLSGKGLSAGLRQGEVFATRLIELDGETMMGGCVYPYGANRKKEVLAYIDKQFSRYVRNEKPGGTMDEFLKAYGDILNLVWMECITGAQEQ